MYSVSMQKTKGRTQGFSVGLVKMKSCPQAGRKWNKRAKMKNRKKSDGKKEREGGYGCS